jgi:DNA-directed RNA polymerase specialized sigma24 family protein
VAKRNANTESATVFSSEEKIARLLAMLVVKDIPSDIAKVPVLRAAGFNTGEIAGLLGTTEATVRAAGATMRKKQKAR